MDKSAALLYAQSIWGAGEFNARVQCIKGKFCVGRSFGRKRSWILGEGDSWEAAFRNFYAQLFEFNRKCIANGNGHVARGFKYSTDDEVLADILVKEQIIASGNLP